MSNSSGPFQATSVTDQLNPDPRTGGIVWSWTNPGNGITDNGSSATNTSMQGNATSSNLNYKNFNISIPSYAVITGIMIEMKMTLNNSGNGFIYLNKGTGKQFSSYTAGGYTSQGGPTDLWGTTWTTADFTNANFIATFNITGTGSGGGTAGGTIDALRITVYWVPGPADVPKKYTYKSYNSAGQYLGNIPYVTSEFNISYDINTAGSQLTIVSAMSADTADQQSAGQITDESGNAITDESGDPLVTEGLSPIVGTGASGSSSTLIKSGNMVVVYEESYYWPNGHIIFQGMIERWESSYGGDSEDEQIVIYVYGSGSDLDNYLLLGSPFTYTLDQSQTTQDTAGNLNYSSSGGWQFYAQSFTTGSTVTNISAIALLLSGTATVTVSLLDSTQTTLLASSTQSVNVSTATEVQFNFPNKYISTVSTQYVFQVTCAFGQSISLYYKNSNVYTPGTAYVSIFSGGSGGGTYNAFTADLYFKTFSGSGQTQATFSSQDPTTGTLLSFMADYRQRGGKIQSSSSTVSATGLTLTLGFNTNTIYEGIQTVLDVSPNGFYYYVDASTNTLYFKQSSSTADILLLKGKHFNKITVVATIEQVKNSVSFFGGIPSGQTTNLYKSYSDPTSVSLYGQRLDRQSDNHVVDATVANAIGNSAIASQKNEQYQTVVTVLDKQYDISSLHVGLVIGFRGFGTFVDSMLAKIVRIDYTPEEATLTLGTLPTLIAPAIEQIRRGLIAQQTVANPTTPS